MAGRVRGAAAAAAAAEMDLRDRCAEVIEALEKGSTDDAARLAHNLTKRYPTSAMAFNIRGYVLEVAGYQTLPDPVRDVINNSAREAYGRASNIEVKCALTGVSHAKALSVCDHMPESYREFKRAHRIVNPVDPAKTHFRLPVGIQSIDPDVRKSNAAAKVVSELMYFEANAEEIVHDQCKELVKIHSKNVTSMEARQARVDAQVLASRFPFSCRAQALFPHLLMGYIANLPAEIPRNPFYQRALRRLEDALDTFDSSLVLCLLRAEIYSAMGNFAAAKDECERGINILPPDDPMQQDVPPGKFYKLTMVKRINMVVEQITVLAQFVEDQLLLNANLAPEEVQADQQDIELDEDEPAEDQNNELNQEEVNGEDNQDDIVAELHHLALVPSQQKERIEIKQSLIYNKQKRKNKLPAHVRPEQIVDNKIVPLEIVDIFAEYCCLMDTCSAKKVVCHICLFEKGIYHRNQHVIGDMILHCDSHKDTGATLKCDLLECPVRMRNTQDKIRHRHYCHKLPKGWWRTW